MVKQSAKSKLARAKELAAYNQQLATEQWSRENTYNSPVNQMNRLEQAGINPHLAFEGIAGHNTAGSLPSGSVDTDPEKYQGESRLAEAVNAIGQGVMAYQQIRSSQIAQQNANILGNLNEQKAELVQAQQEGQRIKNAYESSVSSYKLEQEGEKVLSMRFKNAYFEKKKLGGLQVELDQEIAKLQGLKKKNAYTDQLIENLKDNKRLIQKRMDLLDEEIDSMNQQQDFNNYAYPLMLQGLKLGNANSALSYQQGSFDLGNLKALDPETGMSLGRSMLYQQLGGAKQDYFYKRALTSNLRKTGVGLDLKNMLLGLKWKNRYLDGIDQILNMATRTMSAFKPYGNVNVGNSTQPYSSRHWDSKAGAYVYNF